jgi:hypothetical protein
MKSISPSPGEHRPVAVGQDSDVDVGAADAVEVGVLGVLVAAAEILEDHDREPSLAQRIGDAGAQRTEVTHLAGEEDRARLGPALEVLREESACRGGGVDDQRHGVETKVVRFSARALESR